MKKTILTSAISFFGIASAFASLDVDYECILKNVDPALRPEIEAYIEEMLETTSIAQNTTAAYSVREDSILTYNGDGSYKTKLINNYNTDGDLDSCIELTWTNGMWINSRKKDYSGYMDHKYPTEISYLWKENEWVPSSKTEHIYLTDDTGYSVTRTSYTCEDGDWVGSWKNVTTYNLSGKTTRDESYHTSNGQWIPLNIYEYIYNSSDQLLTQYSYGYGWFTGELAGWTEIDYSYDDNGYQTCYIYLHHELNNGEERLDGYKKECTNDQCGHVTCEITYKWSEARHNWTFVKKIEYAHDQYGNKVKETNYNWVENTQEWFCNKKYECSYDQYGNKTSEMSAEWHDLSNSWIIRSNWERTFDVTGNLLSYIDWIYDNKDEYSYNDRNLKLCHTRSYWRYEMWVNHYKTEWTYDDHGSVLTEIDYNWEYGVWKQESAYYYEYSYNSLGQKITSKKTRSDGAAESTTTYTYDEKGNLVEELSTLFGEDWSEQTKREYSYDDRNRLVEMKNFNTKDGTMCLDYKECYTYDQRDSLLTYCKYEWVDKVVLMVSHKQEYLYDKEGWLYWYENTYYEQGKPCSYTIYTYNSDGEQVNYVSTYKYNNQWENNINLDKMSYEYDNNGNQIKSSQYRWNEGEWILYSLTENLYDENNNHIVHARYSSASNNELTGSEKWEKTYNQDNTVNTETVYKWQDGSWYVDYVNYYYYSLDPQTLGQIDNDTVDYRVYKVFRNGHLYIVHHGRIFNLNGWRR